MHALARSTSFFRGFFRDPASASSMHVCPNGLMDAQKHERASYVHMGAVPPPDMGMAHACQLAGWASGGGANLTWFYYNEYPLSPTHTGLQAPSAVSCCGCRLSYPYPASTHEPTIMPNVSTIVFEYIIEYYESTRSLRCFDAGISGRDREFRPKAKA